MKNKAILISILLNTCIATNVYAKEIDNSNYFYFGSKFNILQPNKITKSDLSNFKNLYDNYWSHSLYGFLMGYQHNAYFGLEISYNNLFTNQNNNDIIRNDKRVEIFRNRYVGNIRKEEQKILEEEQQQINERGNTSNVNTIYSNTNNNSLFSIENNHNVKKTPNKPAAHITNARKTSTYLKLHDNKSNKINIIYPQKNLEITTRFSYPIFNSIDLYSRIGCAINLNKNILKIKNFNTHYPLKNNVFPVISFGMQYKINQNFYSRIEFEKKITYFNNSKSDNLNSINFHFIWNFQNIFSNNKNNNELKSLNFKQEL
ncbi:Outer membrane protein A [Buchnera aphidicola (Chaitophorus populicola)]|uniref:hypothetical protein n=1 Tax=Buchnera aphidicola TaxID=9 RepID=UPI003463D635